MSIPYDRDPEWLPDSQGEEVRVGDFVRNDRGEIWRVTGLRPRQAYDDGIVSKLNGLLDLRHSGFRVERPTEEFSDLLMSFGNLEPLTEKGVSISHAVRVDDDRPKDAFERKSLDNAWRMIDHWEGKLAAKRSELIRRENALAVKESA